MPVIEFEQISKRFPGVAALSDVSFRVESGACHALLGENGAGKSTLGKLLAGIYRPDGGRILLDGQPVQFRSPREATAAGVGIVHQELVFCPNLSIAENLCLHDLPRRGWWLDRPELQRRAVDLLQQVGLDLDPQLPVSQLSIAQEQLLQIAAALGLQARVLVFDEPTSSLGQAETQRLFEIIRRLRADGVTIVYVSHRLEEIFALGTHVTVLRDGKHVVTQSLQDVTQDQLVTWMVGREVQATRPPPQAELTSPVRLQVQGFSSPGKFSEVSLEVRAGEILGIAGLVGAGRTELAEAIFGLDPHATGTLLRDGHVVPLHGPHSAIAAGIGLVPEDRKRHGLVLEMNVRENLALPTLERRQNWWGAIARRPEQTLATDAVAQLRIRTASTETRTATLSGGNQQKIVLAKWVAAGGRVLLVDEPTRGVDVGAKHEIHTQLFELAEQGVAVLVISSDLPELLAVASRLVVLRDGKLVAALTRAEATPERVLRAMAGLVATSN